MSRTCPAAGCGKPIQQGVLLCYRHWRSLPTGLRTAVNRAWDGFRAGTTSREEYERVAAEATKAAR